MQVMMPSPIEAYFEADMSEDPQALLRAFAPDAVVKDEGETHAGRDAIEAWWRAAKVQYQPVVEPLDLEERDDTVRVRSQVTGNFPGSPVMLTFTFRLAGDRIAELEIAP
ncbi:MAG: nuclear transport factor 2 family protein [Parvibaculum sp.]|nr:nuclear transport factor 2 family protein [Parvibaculum sp.]MBO6679987.1 nuclear transport factor 2 family protein [Parvibaculum sp.]MBO6683548.1 nuclear transport factor 2 family protein [Parvibaculum sp.]MBO6904676.1 nuclear transport factor 2 family protein [Parvibaculum sp.]